MTLSNTAIPQGRDRGYSTSGDVEADRLFLKTMGIEDYNRHHGFCPILMALAADAARVEASAWLVASQWE